MTRSPFAALGCAVAASLILAAPSMAVAGESTFLPTASIFINQLDVDMTTQIGRAGINYRF